VRWAALAALVASACGDAKPPSADCAQIADKIRASKLPAEPATLAIIDRLIPAIKASCLDDGWPDDAKACFVAAKPDGPSLAACDRMLPRSVQEKIAHRQAR
jgi:hypothetical protein